MTGRKDLAGPLRLAAFVSPHGFGHAARSSAVMAEVNRRAGAEFEVFSTAPEWFFNESMGGFHNYHAVVCDVGFRQKSALVFDLEETVRALNHLIPFDDELIESCVAVVRETDCRAVLCDISPMGIAVAERAGLPSLLLENFSWPWLYEPLFEKAPALRRLSTELDHWSDQATVHLQTEPLCVRDETLELVDPVGREANMSRSAARDALNLSRDGTVVVVTMGGYREELTYLDQLRSMSGITFLVTGAPTTCEDGNLRLFDNETPLFMPNLLRASDAVVAKLGYGTIAEVWREGLPFAYVTRPEFREMPPLEAFADRELSGFLVKPEEFAAGAWTERIPELLELPRRPRPDRGGAGRVAEALLALA